MTREPLVFTDVLEAALTENTRSFTPHPPPIFVGSQLKNVAPCSPAYLALSSYAAIQRFHPPAPTPTSAMVIARSLLGITDGVSSTELRQRRLALARRYHPDLLTEDYRATATEVIKVVNATIDALSDGHQGQNAPSNSSKTTGR